MTTEETSDVQSQWDLQPYFCGQRVTWVMEDSLCPLDDSDLDDLAKVM